MTHAVREFEFRGTPFKVVCTEREGYQHPSWFSFVDESDVRERDWTVQPGEIVLDVGAAYGSYTLTALAAGAAHVYAWSPQGPPGETPEAVMLVDSASENGWGDRVTIYRGGVYDRDGWLNADTQEFYDAEPEASPSTIRVGTLDDWYRDTLGGRLDRVKLDVEGAEEHVLRGAESLLRRWRPIVHIENHEFKSAGIGDRCRAFLEALGYEEVSRHPHHAVSHSVYRHRG